MAKNSNKDVFAYEQEKRQFIDGLRHFHNGRGTSFGRIPLIGKKEVDLYKLYQTVTSYGGWKKVTDDQRWEDLLDGFNLSRSCVNADQALKFLYIRYLNQYEKVHFLGEDLKNLDVRRDEDGPIRKKLCAPLFNVPLTYNFGQHDIAENLRPNFGLSTDYAKLSDYDKLEKALLSGLPNEVDFVINVCTLLSNESKHTLRLDKSTILTDLLLAHIGIFREGTASFERLYENGWRKYSNRDFVKFWFDTIEDPDARKLISFTRPDNKRSMVGREVLQLGRDLGVEDKEGIRITQISIILRNLSFDEHNMKFLAGNDLVFRFLLLCIHSNYGTLRQLALDTLGNLSAQFILDPVDSFRSKTILKLLVKCITSSDKFSVVRGLEMVSKLSRLDDNEYVLSEKLDSFIFEEIAKYLTVQDIQLIVSSLEALYQLSEIGEETNSKIAEVSNTIDTLVSLITVEAQSYGPNSLVGIKVVEYCPPPHLTADGVPGSVGPPPGSTVPPPQSQGQPTQSQPPGQTGGQMIHASTANKKLSQAGGNKNETAPGVTQMKTTTCNWLQATFEMGEGGQVSHIDLYSLYLAFCKKFQLTQALPTQDFLNIIKVVFPRAKSAISIREDGGKQMCVMGIRKRSQQLPFSISCPPVPRLQSSVAPSTPLVRPPNSAIRSPNLLQRLAAPLNRPVAPKPPLYPAGVPVQQVTTSAASNSCTPKRPAGNTVTVPTYALSGGIAAQGYVNDAQHPPVQQNVTNTPTSSKSKPPSKSKTKKKNPPILPRPDETNALQNIAPKMSQQPLVQNVQYATYPQEIVYQTIDPQNAEAKVMVKTLLAKKIRQGNVIIQQPIQGVVNVDYGGGGDGQAVQYQTSYPQTVPQAAYIQYTTPASTQGTVQTIFQPNPTSQVQTFVVQSGDVYVQNQMPVSSLNQQIITQQQPMVVGQQQQIVPQQQMIPQQQIITQSPVLQQTQFMSQPHVITQNPVVTNPQMFQVASQMAYSTASTCISTAPITSFVSPAVSSAVLPAAEAANALETNAAGSVCASQKDSGIETQQLVGSTQSGLTSSDVQSSAQQPQNPSLDIGVCQEANSGKDSENAAMLNKVQNNTNKPSISENRESMNTENGDESNMDLPSTEAVTEIESAVGSIMGPTGDENMEAQEEPIMIENDGNELMFEQKYQAATDNSSSYVVDDDEAAMAVGQLEQMEQNDAVEESNEVEMETVVTNEDVCVEGVKGNNECVTESEIPADKNCIDGIQEDESVSDQMLGEGQAVNETEPQGEEEDKSENIVAKFRAETPIVVPLVSENGLFEQDFEARMAVENLLKDVEFNVNGDDASSEENVNVYSCQQQENPGSVQTVSSLGDSEIPVCEDSRDSAVSESQTSTKNPVLNHNGPVSAPAKSLTNNSQSLPQNGISSEHRPLVNGNICSQEYQSVPSPTSSVNGGDSTTKLVNGISDDEKTIVRKALDKISKVNGVVNHKTSKVLEICNADVGECEVKMEVDVDSKVEKSQDILAQSLIDSKIESNSDDILAQSIMDSKIDSKPEDSKADGDILAQSILENGIQPSDCDIPDPEPTSVTAVVKQIIPSTMYGNIMTVQINNNTIPISFTNNAIITSSKNSFSSVNVCNSRHIPTPESARDGELSCDSTASSIATSELNIVVSDKHSSVVSQSKTSHKDMSKSLTSPKAGDSKKSKSKKRSRSKSGGSGGSAESRPSSVSSPAAATASLPEYMCEWQQCRKCFDNAKSVFCHVCTVHLKTEFDGFCKWEGCEALVRKRWSLFTHVQDHHCSENSLRVAAQRRLQSFQTGQTIPAPTIPAMVYPNDAATQAIKRFQPKPPYQEFMEGREGPVTKHIRLTSALILRNLARYSPAGRSLLKKHERVISYVCMSSVESSTALANCLFEILQDH